MPDVSVIIPAAGSARRFGQGRNKIFALLAGEPVFLRTLRLFSRRADVCQVLLVVSDDDHNEIASNYGSALVAENVQLVVGGSDRTSSVRNGLEAVADSAELICIHDAVRPCVSPSHIDAVFAAAREHGAAILAWPIHGTIKRAAEQIVTETVDRADLWQAQTPQVFRKDWLIDAYATDHSATDDAALIERQGHSVRLVTGDPRNIKITTPVDLALAHAVLNTLD